MNRPESVLVVVYSRSGQVLLLERTHPAGFWQSVTGTLEWGETAEDAAVRELQEETGLTGLSIRNHRRENRFPILPAWMPRYAALSNVNREYLFSVELAEPVEPRLNPDEHTRFIWCAADVAAEKVYSWTNRDAILALRRP